MPVPTDATRREPATTGDWPWLFAQRSRKAIKALGARTTSTPRTTTTRTRRGLRSWT
jgi:hypothetical protein